MADVPQMRALYYPFSRSLEPTTLKKAALLFDQVAFLDSQPWFVRDQLLKDERAIRAAAVEDDYAYLREQRVMSFVDPKPFLLEFDELLTANVAADIGSDVYLDAGVAHSAGSWHVLRERLPASMLKTFYAGSGTYVEAISLQALVHAEGRLEDLPEELRDLAEMQWEGLTPEKLRERLGDYRFVIGGNPFMELESYELPFVHASSLRINECLLIAGREGYVPFTDSVVHDRLLRLKATEAQRIMVDDPELRARLEVDLPVQLPKEQLALTILDRLLPEDELRKRTVAELVAYRRDHAAAFRRFHDEVAALAAQIEELTPGPDFEVRLRKIVDAEVVPAINASRDDLVRGYEGAFGKVAGAAASAGGAALVATVLPGVGLLELLLATGAAAVAALKAARSARRASVRSLTYGRGAGKSAATRMRISRNCELRSRGIGPPRTSVDRATEVTRRPHGFHSPCLSRMTPRVSPAWRDNRQRGASLVTRGCGSSYLRSSRRAGGSGTFDHASGYSP
jgi:hypothetical protein